MPNVIDFLERMGRDASLRYAPSDAVERALTRAEIDPALRVAVLGDDPSRLEALLGAVPNVCSIIRPAKEEDDEDEDEDADDDLDDEDEDDIDDEDEDEDEDEDDEDDDEKDVLKSRRVVARAATGR